jgi:hypothetical protein
MELAPVVTHQSRLIQMGQVAAAGHADEGLAEQGLGGAPVRRPQHPVLFPPEHLDRLGRQGSAAAGKAPGAGKAGEGLSPAGRLQMQRGDLQLGGPHAGRGIGKGAAGQSASHPRQGEEAHTQVGEEGGEGAGLAGEARRIEEQQPVDPLGAAPCQRHRHSPAHGGADHTEAGRAALRRGGEGKLAGQDV